MRRLTDLLLAASLSRALAAEPVAELTLDEHTLYKIPVSQTRVTTFAFPGAITAIDAVGVTVDGTSPGLFQLAYQPTNFFFSVRALTNGASANINVVFRRKVYVLEVTENKNPALSVILREPPMPLPVPSASSPLEGPRPNLSQLLGLLQKAKEFDTLRRYYPSVLAGAHKVSLNKTNEYDSFRICIKEVTRFDAEDALVFRVTVLSKTGKDIHYKPDSIAVRVGPNLYPAAISDSNGAIYATFDMTVLFAVVGQADGQRNDLSPDNDFVVLLSPLPSP